MYKTEIEYERNSIKKNSFLSFLITVIRILSNFVLYWIIARFYGAEIFGQFTYSFTVVTIFLILADFGIDILLTVELPRNKNNPHSIFQNLLQVKLIFIFISFLLLFVYAFIVKTSSTSSWLLVILSFYLVSSSILNYIFAFFRGLEKFEIETKITFYYNLSLLIGILALVYFHYNIFIIAALLVLLRVTFLLFAIKLTRNYMGRINFSFNYNQIKLYKNKIGVFGIHYIFNYLYYNIDTLILAYILGEKSVGIFQAAFKILVLLLIIPEIINNALFPTLSRLNNENKLEWLNLSSVINKFLILLILPSSVLLYIHSGDIINLIYGKEQYQESIKVLQYYIFVIVIRFLIEPLGMMLTTSNKQKLRAYTVTLTIMISVILNFILIKKFNVIGAVYAAFITNLIVFIIYFVYNLNICFKWYFTLRYLFFVVTFLMYLYLMIITSNFWLHISINFLFIIIVGTFIFFNKKEKEILLPKFSFLRKFK